jgi:hypothetical protein
LFTAWVETIYHRRTHTVTGNHGPLALRRPVLGAIPALAEAFVQGVPAGPAIPHRIGRHSHPKAAADRTKLVKGQDVHDRGERYSRWSSTGRSFVPVSWRNGRRSVHRNG